MCFTIAKLRSFGSDNFKNSGSGSWDYVFLLMKMETVFQDEPFMLNYIVDFTEEDFAEKLIAEINGDRPAAKLYFCFRYTRMVQRSAMSSTKRFLFHCSLEISIDPTSCSSF